MDAINHISKKFKPKASQSPPKNFRGVIRCTNFIAVLKNGNFSKNLILEQNDAFFLYFAFLATVGVGGTKNGL